MEITPQEIREYIEKIAEIERPKSREEVLKILEEVFHQLKVEGRIRSDADLKYWKQYFSSRWDQFIKN